METLPVIGGVSVCLLDEPYVDCNFRLLHGFDLMALPGIREGVRFAMKARARTKEEVWRVQITVAG